MDTDERLKIFDEELVKKYLNNASLFLLMRELLKSSIVDSIRNFFIEGIDEKGPIISDEYKREVLSLDTKVFTASCIWSINMQIITQEDFTQIKRLNLIRNNIAHRLVEIVYEENKDISNEDILIMYSILSKIDKWWIKEVEIPTDPDLYDKEINTDEILSGRMIISNYLLKAHLIEIKK